MAAAEGVANSAIVNCDGESVQEIGIGRRLVEHRDVLNSPIAYAECRVIGRNVLPKSSQTASIGLDPDQSRAR